MQYIKGGLENVGRQHLYNSPALQKGTFRLPLSELATELIRPREYNNGLDAYLGWLLQGGIQAMQMKRKIASIAQQELSALLALLAQLLMKVWEGLKDHID